MLFDLSRTARCRGGGCVMAKKNIHTTPKVYFSDHFNVDRSIIEDYGAVDISLVADISLLLTRF